MLRVEIEDTGPGLSPEDQEKLFRHFEQTKTGQQTGTGTGLGLAISREFVCLMGGAITVHSQVGKGSIFEIQLPLNEGEAQAIQTKDNSLHVLRLQPDQPTCRVLIADDIEDNRQLLAQLHAGHPWELDVKEKTSNLAFGVPVEKRFRRGITFHRKTFHGQQALDAPQHAGIVLHDGDDGRSILQRHGLLRLSVSVVCRAL